MVFVFHKAVVSWIWVNVFQRRACIMLTLAYFFVYGKPAKCWVYIYVFALVAGLPRCNFGSSCTNLILTKSFSWLFLVFVIVILAFFFAPVASLYHRDFDSFLFVPAWVYTIKKNRPTYYGIFDKNKFGLPLMEFLMKIILKMASLLLYFWNGRWWGEGV